MTNRQMRLTGKRIAALVTDGFEEVELTDPVNALNAEGAEVDVIVPEGGTVRAWKQTDWGAKISADAGLEEADPTRYDGLLLPGGVMSPDRLRMDERAVSFVRAFVDLKKPIAAICHGPWTLINAGAVRGRQMTSYPSLQADLEHAGAHWVDREVVIDDNLITSRNPDDLPVFSQALIDALARPTEQNGQVSEAPNTSFDAGSGRQAIGEDPAALAGNALGNEAYPHGNTYPQPEEVAQPDESPRPKD
jgi:protease I